MPRGKKNSTTPSAALKTASKSVAEPIKEKAAVPKPRSVKPTAEKKKATATTKSFAKKALTSAAAKADSAGTVTVTETKKAAPKTTKKVATNTTMKSTAAKTKTSAASTTPKTAATDNKKRTVKKTAKGKSDEIVLQSSGKDYTLSEITQICKDAYRGGTRKRVKSIKVYVKAEKNKLVAYYVVNDSVNGSVNL